MKVLAIITARSGSKRLPRKNQRLLAGLPLLGWTILAAMGSTSISRTVVSTDSADIADIALTMGCEVPCLRPAALSQDLSDSRGALIHMTNHLLMTENYIPDVVLTLQPTSPFRTSSDIDRAVELFQTRPDANSLVSVVSMPPMFAREKLLQLMDDGTCAHEQGNAEMSRADHKTDCFVRNGAAIYLTRASRLAEGILVPPILAFRMPLVKSIDINTQEEWDLAVGLEHLLSSGHGAT